MDTLRAVAAFMLVGSAASAETLPHARIVQGMTITEVQALIGPPYTIKSLHWREVLFYCPTTWFGIPIGQPIYTTVWLSHRRVVASRTLIGTNLFTCEQFIAAFQWTDPLPIPTARQQSEWHGHDGGTTLDRPATWRPPGDIGR